MPSLREKQSEFVSHLIQLLLFAEEAGYEITLGDAWSKPQYKAHKRGSKHYSRLAIDLNLFENGKYLRKTEDHRILGKYWESLGGIWGGRFKKKDGNHYEWPY